MLNLKNIPFFADLQEKQLEKLQNIVEVVEVEESTFILKEGSVGQDFFILVQGKVKIVKQMLAEEVASKLTFLTENKKTLAILEGKDYPLLGEMALIDADRRSANVIALTQCTLLKITQQDFLKLAQEDPLLAFKILLKISQSISQKLRLANKNITKLTTALALLLQQKTTK